MINGIITFLGTKDLDKTDQFYQGILNLELIKDQRLCKIYRITKEASIGFCEHIEPTIKKKSPIITFLCSSVDKQYNSLRRKDIMIETSPRVNEKFGIYHFFIKDPNGYTLEFQKFIE